MAAMASEPTPESETDGSSPGAGLVSRIRWFILAAGVAAARLAGAFLQPVRPDPYASPRALSFDWWRYPTITGSLNGVHALRNSEHEFLRLSSSVRA